jgi:hypothetical protein
VTFCVQPVGCTPGWRLQWAACRRSALHPDYCLKTEGRGGTVDEWIQRPEQSTAFAWIVRSLCRGGLDSGRDSVRDGCIQDCIPTATPNLRPAEAPGKQKTRKQRVAGWRSAAGLTEFDGPCIYRLFSTSPRKPSLLFFVQVCWIWTHRVAQT